MSIALYSYLCPPSYFDAGDLKPSIDFAAYPKTPRLEKETVRISEKVDGTNGALFIHKAKFGNVLNGSDKSYILAGSKSRWLVDNGTKSWDNHGFGQWVRENEDELMHLPEGFHYGEWYGKGINAGYGLKEKKFMLFNWNRYKDLEDLPKCVELETVLAEVCLKDLTDKVEELKNEAETKGSWHVPGFKTVEGLILRFKLSAKVLKEVWNKS